MTEALGESSLQLASTRGMGRGQGSHSSRQGAPRQGECLGWAISPGGEHLGCADPQRAEVAFLSLLLQRV